MADKQSSFFQPTSESDFSKGQSSLETPTTQEEAIKLESQRQRLRDLNITPGSGGGSSSSSSYSSSSSSTTKRNVSNDLMTGQSTRDDGVMTQQEQFIEGAKQEPQPVSQAPRTSQRVQREELSNNSKEIVKEKLSRAIKPRETIREELSNTPDRFGGTEIRADENRSLSQEEIVRETLRRAIKPRETIREGVPIIRSELDKVTQSSERLRGEKTFETELKSFLIGAANPILGGLEFVSTPISQSSEFFSADIQRFFEGEQTEFGTSLGKSLEDPAVGTGELASSILIGGAITKISTPKPSIISQEGRIISTRSTAIPDELTVINTDDFLNVRTGKRNIQVEIKGAGTVKPEIDDVFIGSQKRKITFKEDGDIIGITTERADFNIRDIDGEIRAEGSTITVDPNTGKNIFGRFQATKVGLPDDSFVNRIISGSSKRRNFKDINPDVESIGFQRQQFEITKPVDVDIDLGGIKITKQSIETKSVDLTSSSGVSSKASNFEIDFLGRKELLKIKSENPTVKIKTGDDPLLGPIRVQGDDFLFSKSDLPEGISKSKPFSNNKVDDFVGPKPQETMTVKRTKSKSSPVIGISNEQILKALPSNDFSTPSVGFGPIGNLLNERSPTSIKNRFQDNNFISKVESFAPSDSQIITGRKLDVNTVPDEKAVITPITESVLDLTPDISKVNIGKSKSKQDDDVGKITTPSIDVSQTNKQLQKQAQKQLQKQDLKQSFSLSSLPPTNSFNRSNILTPFPTFLEKKKSSPEFTVQVRRGGEFSSIFKTRDKDIAFRTGASEVKGRSSASFRILEGNKILDLEGRSRGIKKSTREKGVFIEESKFRINTPGELAEITLLGIRSDKNKKKKKKKKSNSFFNF